jgi:undecaprenyl diphosphate synthase
MVKMIRLPKHIGIIPDGNRRWAIKNGLHKKDGYMKSIDPSKMLYDDIRNLGVKEVTVYCFTAENVKRLQNQKDAFKEAIIDIVNWIKLEDVSLLVVGDHNSKVFPQELLYYTNPQVDREKRFKVNLLVNYSWKWDIKQIPKNIYRNRNITHSIGSDNISNVDLIIRWGGRSRLSGFIPLQSAYVDLFVIDDFYPDYKIEHISDALKWYNKQDRTLGG